MELNEYQKKAIQTAIYPHMGTNLYYPLLGLGSEVGELQGKLAKAMRDNEGMIDEELRAAMALELGDVLWMVQQTAYELDMQLEEIAQMNLKKLADRQARNVIGGSGDNR